MKVNDLITEMAAEIESTAETADYVRWINEVNDDLFTNRVDKLVSSSIDAVEDQVLYTLPEGITFEQIEEFKVEGSIYPMTDLREEDTKGYYEDGDYVGIYPVPAADTTDGIEIVFKWIPPHHLVARITGDSLRIPAAFKNVYKYYCYFKIYLDQRHEPGEANNYSIMYNNELTNYIMYRSHSELKRGRTKRRRWQG